MKVCNESLILINGLVKGTISKQPQRNSIHDLTAAAKDFTFRNTWDLDVFNYKLQTNFWM